MGELISRQAAIDAFEDAEDAFGYLTKDWREVLEQLPPIQPEIVRCKDCKHRYVEGDNVRYNTCELNHNNVQSDDWYCADAERRDDDVTCDNCDYSEKYTDGLILCRRTKISHQVSATSTCGKGKREAKDELQKTSNDE